VATSSRYFFGAFTVAIAAVMLAACSGSPSSQVTPFGTAQTNSRVTNLNHDTKCRHHGDVRVDVDPCAIDFTASDPGPFTITVNIPEEKKGTITESDNCGGASGIATVTQGTGDTWVAAAGATTGSCTATFSFNNKRGRTIGTASLSITNSI
jgi:hypothetical protein